MVNFLLNLATLFVLLDLHEFFDTNLSRSCLSIHRDEKRQLRGVLRSALRALPADLSIAGMTVRQTDCGRIQEISKVAQRATA